MHTCRGETRESVKRSESIYLSKTGNGGVCDGLKILNKTPLQNFILFNFVHL